MLYSSIRTVRPRPMSTLGGVGVFFLFYSNAPTQCIPKNPLRSFDDTLPRKQLRNHKVAHILIGPVRKMRSNTGDQGDVEDAPGKNHQPIVP